MVDEERLTAILARVTERLRTLDAYAARDVEELLANDEAMGNLKYTFQTAIEACTDAAHHVVASEGLGQPTSNGDAVQRLADAGHVTDELAATIASAVGFRNVLVHGYADVDDAQVVANLAHRADLRRYVRELAALLTGALDE